ncbi:hypothetical protein DPMN_025363 [Dreissena polymorpha]|uniref:Uncharacterized protein n=1 Tax=Dreissena polymorpha TaxID=45954 RepID=A0A9D4RBL3_DREPO|nr:hypothetical protein DPMN_025363 [Dreissena polymorpha]
MLNVHFVPLLQFSDGRLGRAVGIRWIPSKYFANQASIIHQIEDYIMARVRASGHSKQVSPVERCKKASEMSVVGIPNV